MHFSPQDIKKSISDIEDLIVHNNCLQFVIQIKQQNDGNNNNDGDGDDNATMKTNEGVAFSELFNKLHALTIDRGIYYTITECLLDRAFDRVLETDAFRNGYDNTAYQQSETPT